MLDMLGALTEEVIWLQKVVMQQSQLIISSLVKGDKESMEKLGDPEWETGSEVTR